MSRKSFVFKLVGAIMLLGAAALVLGSFALQKIFQPDERERPRVVKDASPFDGQRAFEDLKRIVAIGPRPAGSPQAGQTRVIIKEALESAGLEVREHAFVASTPAGKRDMVNLVGVVQGDTGGVIVIGNH